jgi:glycosyltransferase involved in cell wall biosynthesis
LRPEKSHNEKIPLFVPQTADVPTVIFTVTNDLSYDQRMIRICTSLVNNGFDVILVGRKKRSSILVLPQPFVQRRLYCFFGNGALFYAEFNIRLFFFLLFRKLDGMCAIDLDTILPVYLVSLIRKKVRIYDAHELFCEMKEIVERPHIYRTWKWIEKRTVPDFKYGYTVNRLIAEEFRKMYGSDFRVIRSLPVYAPVASKPSKKFILYQGAVNEGRCFETLIPAMQSIKIPLVICGDGNFMEKARKLAKELPLPSNIIFTGYLRPDELLKYTNDAYIGLTLFEPGAKSNYFSLANRFFDYVKAGVPQLCVDYPAYREINDQYHVAELISDLSSENIALQINKLLEDENRWQMIREKCILAAKELNWEKEEIKLIEYYRQIFG